MAFVFLNGEGQPWTMGSLTHLFRDICERADLPMQVRLHGGRHTFATNAIMNGVGIATLAQLLGHRDVQCTHWYTHLIDKRFHLNTAMNQAVGKGAPATVAIDVPLER
jgi:site-specific recombinase XerD